MDQLTMKLVKKGHLSSEVDVDGFPERVIQFGEGNFLRGFIDWMIHEMNRHGIFNGRVVAIQPTPHGKVVPKLNEQDGFYTLVLRGLVDGKERENIQLISSIKRGINPYEQWEEVLKVAENKTVEFVFSNTTENGLVYHKEQYVSEKAPSSFPGKLTAFLYHRYKTLGREKAPGMVIIPCELVEDNGNLLEHIVIKIADDWDLPEGFKAWIKEANQFCNTLVDRIITGYPADEINEFIRKLGYEDKLLTVGEPYHLFAIDGNDYVSQKLPFHKAGLNVQWGSVKSIRELKTRVLNGAHTMMFPIGFLAGKTTVYEAMKDNIIERFIEKAIDDDILPYVDFSETKKSQFAKATVERFLNPYIKHHLIDIGQNSLSKFKTRLLPTLTDAYQSREESQPLKSIAFSLAALLMVYRPYRVEDEFLIGKLKNNEYKIRDNPVYLQLLKNIWETNHEVYDIIHTALSEKTLWEMDLTQFACLIEATSEYAEMILSEGIIEALNLFLKAVS